MVLGFFILRSGTGLELDGMRPPHGDEALVPYGSSRSHPAHIALDASVWVNDNQHSCNGVHGGVMSESTRKHILLVEDQVLIAMTEKMQLEKYGYAVRTVTSGEKALDAVQEFSDIDLILMDIDLGNGIDGTQAAEMILRDHDLPVVFLSSHTEPEIVEKTEKITSYGYVVKNADATVLDASIKMAFKLFCANRRLSEELAERTRIEIGLQESEEKFRALFEKGPIGVAYHEMVYDDTGRAIDYHFLDANMSYIELTGVDPRGKRVTEAFPGIENDPFDWIGTFGRVANTGEPIRFEQYFQPNERWYDCVGYQVKPGFFVAAFVEISERKRMETELTESMTRYENLVTLIPVGIYIFWMRASGKVEFEYVSDRWCEIHRVRREDVLRDAAVADNLVHPDYRESFRERNRAAARDRKPFHWEGRFSVGNGELRWLRIESTPVVLENGDIRWFGVTQDVTEREQAHKEIQKQLDEKELLLREVHHRVKNNIANVESLLSLQAGSTANAEARAMLQDAISRVQSMRVLYDKLVLSKDLHEVSVKSFAEGLIDSLVMFFDPENRIRIQKQLTDFTISAKQATTVGIILNELLTNVFKHAFGNRENGIVTVSIDKEENEVSLVIEDNGVGFDEIAFAHESPGLGFTIVKMLAEQCNGTYSLSNDNGARSLVRLQI